MRASAVLIVAAFVATASAEANYTFPAGFNITNVTSTELSAWCQGERNTCPLVCDGSTETNSCSYNSTTIDFDCVCSNGTTPDLSPYEQTIPFYVCEETYIQCIANNPNDLDAQDSCKANATCGTIDLSASSTTSSSASSTSAASTTAASGSSTTGSATATGATATTTTSKAAAAALQIAQDHSTSFFAAAMLAVFGMFL